MRNLSRLVCRLVGAKRYYLPPPDAAANDAVVLVHGLIRRGRCMYYLGRRLNRAGYAVYVYDYPTTRKNIVAHSEDLLAFLDTVAAAKPGQRLHIITHSLGSIITREALARLEQRSDGVLKAENIGGIVMLAPPNQGSDMARTVVRLLPLTRRWIKPLGELSSEPDAYIHQAAIPRQFDIGIIAARFDNKVAGPYTRLAGMKDHIVINSTHSTIMYLPRTEKQILHFLRERCFYR